MTFMDRLQQIDRRVIYVLLAGAVFFALLNPIGLPITVGALTQAAYDNIEALPAGSIVYFGADFSASSGPELRPTLKGAMTQAFEKDLRIVGGAMWNEGGTLLDQVWQEVSPKFPDKKYGVDFVNLGYKPGNAVYLERMMSDVMAATVGQDHFGKPLADLPIMAEFKTMRDAKLVFGFCSGDPGTSLYISRVTDVAGMPLNISTVAVSVPEAMAFVQSNQIKGLVGGMQGAAQYELLSGTPGPAISGMDAQSLVAIFIIVFMALGNIGYVASKNKK